MIWVGIGFLLGLLVCLTLGLLAEVWWREGGE